MQRDGTSWINKREARWGMIIARYLARHLAQARVCVLCLYKAQRELVRAMLDKRGYGDVATATVDEVQGREWEVRRARVTGRATLKKVHVCYTV